MIGVKNIYLRFMVKWKNMNKMKFDEEQEYLYQVVMGMLVSPDTTCSVAPDSEKYYVVNLKHSYYIVLTYDYIKLTNHNHHIGLNMGQKYMGELILKVRKKIEKDLDNHEKTIFKNQIDLLKKIISTIKDDNPITDIKQLDL